MKRALYLATLFVAGSLCAQSSASFRLTEVTFNAGGRPGAGDPPTSASYRIDLEAIGDTVVSTGLASGSFRLDSGFVAAFRPPGEIDNLHFADPTQISWDADPAALSYALYQGTVTQPFDPDFGTCAQPPPPLVAPTASIAGVPDPGETSFFLVTARNRLGEESSKGSGTANDRPNPAACP